MDNFDVTDFMNYGIKSLLNEKKKQINMNLYGIFLKQAYDEARNSPDLSTQNGAIIVKFNEDGYKIVGRGCNQFTPGVEITESKLERPLKYLYTEHAERYAIFNATESLKDTVMFAPWAACADCARAIVLSGIKKLVVYDKAMKKTPDSWKQSVNIGSEILKAGNIIVDYCYESQLTNYQLRFNEELWSP